jgi:hypothetical protein
MMVLEELYYDLYQCYTEVKKLPSSNSIKDVIKMSTTEDVVLLLDEEKVCIYSNQNAKEIVSIKTLIARKEFTYGIH